MNKVTIGERIGDVASNLPVGQLLKMQNGKAAIRADVRSSPVVIYLESGEWDDAYLVTGYPIRSVTVESQG